MKRMCSDWYRKIWSLDIQDQSWVEDTVRQVDFLEKTLGLRGGERILDLACGFGRHSLKLARRGYLVTGVDITPAYVDFANTLAEKERLNARFLCLDIRQVPFESQFDVVLNMADGAVGYLKPGGKHFMDIMNGGYARTHFPCKLWDAGKRGLTLSLFEWDEASRILTYGQRDFPYGEPLTKPEFPEGNPIRLYTLSEITDLLEKRGMTVVDSFSDFSGKPSFENAIQLMVYSRKN